MRNFLNTQKQKLILIILIALFLTKVSSPVIGEAEPIQPNLVNLSAQIREIQQKIRLPDISFIPKLSLNPLPSTPDYNVPTSAPEQPVTTEQPTTPGVSTSFPKPTMTALDLLKRLPTRRPTQPMTPRPINPSTEPITKPTAIKTPKPTKIPKIKPTPFLLSNPRPGKNFQDAANIAGEIVCIPPAMLMAILENEYGAWMKDVEADWVNRNTYKGYDPHDKAGSTAIPHGVVVQMMQDTWHRIKPIIAEKYLNTNEISIDVTFDAIVAGGYHLRNISLAMQNHVSCDDWPAKYILYGACRYNGACPANTFGESQYYNDYTYNVCNSYNKYSSQKKNCH